MHHTLLFVAAFLIANFIWDAPNAVSATSECTGENCTETPTTGGSGCEREKKEDTTS